MKRLFLVIVVGLALAFIGASAQSATYYVATSGLDSNPGTQALPWATLQKAVDTIAAGDTIIVKPGVYVGCRIRSSGTSGAPKTLMSESLHAAAITSPGPLNRKSCNLELDANNYTDPNSYWVVDGFEIKNAPVAGVKALLAPYLTFRNNWCHNNGTGGNGHDGFYGIAPYGLFENNEFNNNAEHGSYVGQGSMDYYVERNNISYSNAQMGFHHNGDSGAPFDDGSGMMDYMLCERNKSWSNVGSHGMDLDGVRYSTVRNNLIYGNGNCGIMSNGMGGKENSHHNRILNNTVRSVSNWAFLIYTNTGGTYNNLFNNILYCNGTNGSIGITTKSQTGFQSNYNVVEDKFQLGGKSKTLAQWRAYGYDLNSIIATPAQLFVNEAAGDYHLRSTSPAINAGTTLTDVTNDLEGYPRTAGSYDIGCYEYH